MDLGMAGRKAIVCASSRALDAIRAEWAALILARRFGPPAERLCAFVARAHAGYITGQNLLIDGGAFPGAI